jgi:hypothetical protein
MAEQPNPQSGHSAKRSGNPEAKGFEKIIARWTTILGVSTIALVIATSVSAYFLWSTDQTIGKQVEAVKIQLRAYVGTNQVGYVVINRKSDVVPPKKTPAPPPVFFGANLAVTWKNFGSTPAKNAEHWVSAKWYAAGTEPDFSKPDVKLSDRIVFNIGPGGEIAGGAVFVPAVDIQKAISGDGRIFFWGHIKYYDSFPDTPVRNFHFCMVGQTLATEAGSPASFNIYKPDCNYSD